MIGIHKRSDGVLISHSSYAVEATEKIRRILKLSSERYCFKKCGYPFDGVKKGKIYEIKTTKDKDRFRIYRNNPIRALSFRGQRQNIDLLDYMAVALSSDYSSILKLFVYNVRDGTRTEIDLRKINMTKLNDDIKKWAKKKYGRRSYAIRPNKKPISVSLSN